MLKTLLKINLQNLFLTMFSGKSGKEKKKKKSPLIYVLIALLAVYVIATLVASVSLMFSSVANAFGNTDGMEWFYFALAGILVFLLTFVGSVFTTQNLIFKAKDNELLLSMPVPMHYILFSRLSSLIILDLAYALLLGGPLIGVYFYHHGFSASMLALYAVCVILTVILSTAVTTFIGWLVALISTKFKRSNILQTVMSLAFFGVYMVVVMNMQTYIEMLLTRGEEIARAIQKALPAFYYFGIACAYNKLWAVALLAVISFIPFALACILVSKSFIRIATAKKSANKKKYVAKELSAKSAKSALFRKELSGFFSIPMYILNSAFGGLMLVMLSAYIAFSGSTNAIFTMLGTDEEIASLMPIVISAVIGFCSSMCNTGASAISLEGSRINLLRSMPVNSDDFYFAKYAVNFVVGFVPLTVSVILLEIGLRFDLLTILAVYVSSVCFLAVTSFINLTCNMLMPKFSWASEMMIIKQSGAVLAAMLSGMAVTATAFAPAFLATKFISTEIYLLILSAVCIAVCFAFIGYYKTSGKKRFERMSA
ncbi:MAG: hypothetical protein IJO36_08090 [Clostridia bacterium]|nr:hypothetical protein [Clostridia bacterium]